MFLVNKKDCVYREKRSSDSENLTALILTNNMSFFFNIVDYSWSHGNISATLGQSCAKVLCGFDIVI